MNKNLIFTIEVPRRDPDGDRQTQVFHICAVYPTIMYANVLNSGSSFSTEQQVKLAVLELKTKLIAEIAAAEFTVKYE